MLAKWLFIAMLVWCAVSDVKKQEIPDTAVLLALAASMGKAWMVRDILSDVVGVLLAFVVGFTGFALGGMGGGDVKFMVALGAWFGFPAVVYVLLLSSVLGVVWGLLRLSRLGLLRSWTQQFFCALTNAVLLRSFGALAWERLPESPDMPSPPQAIPFGACLAAAGLLAVVFF